MSERVETTEHAEPGAVLLEAEKLSLKLDGRWLFRKLDLELRAGEFLAVSGPSGVGKTSLLHALAGMWKPTEGIVRFPFLNSDSECIEQASRHVGIIFQDLLLTPNATLLQNVLCGRLKDHSSLRTLFGFSPEEREAAFQMLDEFDLGAAYGKWVAETSRGEQQRVAIARALHQDPVIFLADEPVASLDEALAERVLTRLAEQARKEDKAIVCVLHDPRQIERFADRVIELSYESPEICLTRRNRGSSS